MKRTKYFNQTRPSETQLNWGEESRVNSIQQRLRSSAQMGISWGFQVTVNSLDNTKIDIARGEGYTGGIYLVNAFEGSGSSERISTYTDTPSGSDDLGPAATALGLADYTAGVKNYVSLVYSETESYALSERSYPFTSHMTVVSETFTSSVLTEADWNALSSDDMNNRILVAIVTATGAGVPLTSSNIEQFVQPKTTPTTTQLGTLAGITVNGIADITPLGTGTFRWESSTHKLYWTAPGDIEGAGVTITDSAVYTLYSNSPSYWIRISIVYGTLTLFGDTSDSITVKSLYGRTIPMFSAVDQAHRDMIGSGVPTVTNPHGISIDDLSGGGYDHADLFHRNGISYDAEPTQLQVAVAASPDELTITNIGTYNNSFLVDGVTRNVLADFGAGTPGNISFDVLPVPDTGEYLVYVDSNGSLHTLLLGEPLWDTDIKIVDMENTVAGDGTISYTYNALSPNGSFLEWQAPGDANPGPAVRLVRSGTPAEPVYYKLYSEDPLNWVIVRLTGKPGLLNNSTTFTTEKDRTTYPDEIMLKLACVTWTSGPRQFSDIRDIRSFLTADDKTLVLEEHDDEGKHTKVLQNTFMVANVSNDAIRAEAANRAVSVWADTAYGIYSRADSYAVYGSVSANTGVYGKASASYGVYGVADASYGVYGSAAALYGVYGKAGNYAVYGSASSFDVANTVIGVHGTARNAGVDAKAIGVQGLVTYTGATGVAGVATVGTGVYGNGSVGVFGYTTDSYGVYGSAAVSAGVYGKAPVIGVEASAANTAMYAYAAANTAVYAYAAANTAVYGIAAVLYGIYGKAPRYGVFGYADVEYGVYGKADVQFAVYGSAPNTAIKGIADTNSAVVGEADGNFGVVGSATSYGVYGYANNYAIYGLVESSARTAIYGYAAHESGGFGIVGQVDGVGEDVATAVLGIAHGDPGIVPSDRPVAVCGTASNGFGGRFFGEIGVFCGGDEYGIYVSNTIGYLGVAGAATNAGTQHSLLPFVWDGTAGYIMFYKAP